MVWAMLLMNGLLDSVTSEWAYIHMQKHIHLHSLKKISRAQREWDKIFVNYVVSKMARLKIGQGLKNSSLQRYINDQ